MKATTKLLVAALAAAGMAVSGAAMAQSHGHAGGHFSGGRVIGGHFNGGHFVGHRGFVGPRFGFFFGAPLLFGWPYYYDYYYPYPGATVIYRDVEPVYEAPGQVVPPTTEAAPGPGAPAQGPLYMNYCESARAYYPKVTACPEGWKFITPTR